MFYDHRNNHHHRQQPTDRPRTMNVRLVREEFRGQWNWYAAEVPREWRGDIGAYFHTVRVNLPKRMKVLEGELWEVRLQEHQRVRGILFADGKRKLANPDGVPDYFEAGMTLIVADTPENGDTRIRRTGKLAAATAAHLPGMDWIDLVFDEIDRHVLQLESGHLPRERGNELRLTRLHRTGPTWHAYYGDRLVELYRGRA